MLVERFGNGGNTMAATWVLILALVVSGGANSMTTVPGYSSKAACVAAGNEYLKAKLELFDKFACIPGPMK